MATTQEVARAVAALYGHDAQQQGEANRWLMAFAETSAAWDVCRELVLTGSAHEIQFFGANVLHTKVRREWHGLAQEARQQAFSALSALVIETVRREQPTAAIDSGIAGRMLVCKRLCLALGSAAAQQAELCAPCVSMALGLGASEHGLPGMLGAFALLGALADEIEALASGGNGGGVQQQPGSAPSARASAADLRPFVTPVAQLAEAHIAPTEARSASSLELRRAALGCLRTWTSLCADLLSVRELASRHAALLEGILAALGDQEAAEMAADALTEACSLEVLSFTLEPSDVLLVATISERFLRHRPQLAAAAAQRSGDVGEEADMWAAAFTRALGQFAACAARPLACASAGPSAESAQLQQLVLLMLECASYPAYTVSENLVDVWVSLQDIPMADRAEAMRAPLFERLLTATITRCMWAEPSAAGHDDDDDDDDDEIVDFEKWRHQSASEVITCCLAALGGAVFASALASLLPGEPPASAGAWAGVWRRVEVVAFALSAVHIELKSKLRASSSLVAQPSAPPTTPTGDSSPLPAVRMTATEALALDKAAVDSALSQLFGLALSLPPLAALHASAAANGCAHSACALPASAASGSPQIAQLGASSRSGGASPSGARAGSDVSGLSAVVDWRLLPTVCAFTGLYGSWLKARPQLVEPALEVLLAAAASSAPCAGGSGLSVALASVGRAVPAGASEAPRLQLAAAEAFRSVCAHCSAQLISTGGQPGSSAASSALVDALVRAVSPLLDRGARIVVADGVPLGQDARIPLAEALGRLIAAAEPTQPEAAVRALQALVGTPVRSLQLLLARAGGEGAERGSGGDGARKPGAELCAAIGYELQLISASIRFCDGDTSRWPSRLVSIRASAPGAQADGAGGGQQPPPISPLLAVISELWPLLEQLALVTGGDVHVVDALLDLLSRTVLCAKAQLYEYLPHILALAANAFAATRALGALALLKAAVEVHGAAVEQGASAAGAGRAGTAPPAVRDALARALASMTATALGPLLSSPHALTTDAELVASAGGGGGGDSAKLRAAAAAAAESEPQLLEGYFELVQRVLLFCPQLLLALPAQPATDHSSLPALLEATVRCVTHQEMTHTRTCVTFACQLVERSGQAAATGGMRKGGGVPAAALEPHGAKLTAACILGLISLSPENLIDHQCELLRVLLEAWPAHVCAQWLSAALQHEVVHAAASAAGGENVTLFLQLLSHRPPLKHDAIAREFARMCRREAGAGGDGGLRRFVPG